MGPCRLDSPICSVALSGQAPQPRSGAPKARGLRANARTRATIPARRCPPFPDNVRGVEYQFIHIIEALIVGETNPVKLANLASRRVKASPEELREALRGRVTKHHRFLLRLHLNQIDTLDAAMPSLSRPPVRPFIVAPKLVATPAAIG